MLVFQDIKFCEEGIVLESLPNANFKVKMDRTGFIKTCYLAGKVRENYIRIMPGDRIRAEFSHFNPMRGRIIFRIK
ncbi:translation initiation factor IF-1 [Candidatus Vidania fulgoroideorum]